MHVLINGTEKKLFSSSLKDIRLTLDAARAKMPSVPKGTVPGVDACLNALLTGPFLAHLLDALNRPVGKIPNTKSVLPQDVNVFLNVLFLLHRHKCSPEDFFKELGFGAKSQYGTHPELPPDSKDIFLRCLNGLSYTHTKEHRGTKWAESQVFFSTLADAAKSKSVYSKLFILFVFTFFYIISRHIYIFTFYYYYF